MKQIPNTHWLISGSFTLWLPLFFSSTSFTRHCWEETRLHSELRDRLCASHWGLVVQSVSLLFCFHTRSECQCQVHERKNTILSPCQSAHQQHKGRMHIYNAEFGAWFCLRIKLVQTQVEGLVSHVRKKLTSLWLLFSSSLCLHRTLAVTMASIATLHKPWKFDVVLLVPAGFPPKY